MENDFYTQERQMETDRGYAGISQGRYTARTFLLMFVGLLVTFGVAMFFGWTRSGLTVYYNAVTYIPAFHIILLLAQLGVALGMTAFLRKLSPAGALACFLVYSVLTGFVFTFYFIVFEVQALLLAFGATALYFGGMAVFGYVTDIDLSRIRAILLGGLIFLILMNALMLFLPGFQAADQVLCTVGVVIFLAYTAYDTQKIRAFYQAYQGNEEMMRKASVYSALQLYLDFVNLFLYLLRIMGKRKR